MKQVFWGTLIILGVSADYLSLVAIYCLPFIIAISLFSDFWNNLYALMMLFLFSWGVKQIGELLNDMVVNRNVKTYLETFNDRLGLASIGSLRTSNKGSLSYRFPISFVVNSMNGKIFVMYQTTFESGYIASLNAIASKTEGYIFLPRNPSQQIDTPPKTFELFHEIGHCHRANVEIYRKHIREICFLAIPVTFWIWTAFSDGLSASWFVGCGIILMAAHLATMLPPIERFRAEMHADNIGLRLMLALYQSNIQLLKMSGLKLPASPTLSVDQQNERQNLFDLTMDWFQKFGYMRNGILETKAPFGYRLFYLVIMILLSWLCFWHVDFASFPWDAVWLVMILVGVLTGMVVFSRLSIHLLLIKLVDEVGELHTDQNGIITWTKINAWYQPKWDIVGYLKARQALYQPKGAVSQTTASSPNQTIATPPS